MPIPTNNVAADQQSPTRVANAPGNEITINKTIRQLSRPLNGFNCRVQQFRTPPPTLPIESDNESLPSSSPESDMSTPPSTSKMDSTSSTASSRMTSTPATSRTVSTASTSTTVEYHNPSVVHLETHLLVNDYIRHRLLRADYDWEEAPELPEADKVRLVMRTLCAEMERRYKDEIDQYVSVLHISPTSMYNTFMGVATTVFDEPSTDSPTNPNKEPARLEGINWGRIVTFFSFCGLLAVHCAEHDMEQMIGNIVDWAVAFVVHRLQPWIMANEGWNGLVEFYTSSNIRRQESEPVDSTNQRWVPPLKAVAAAAVAGGVVLLGRTISR